MIETTTDTKRSTAFQINGGAGRVLCAIPALEQYQITNPEDDFIIVTESSEVFAGHPTLYDKVYSFNSQHLFYNKIKDRDVFIPEPYAVWEYYNQKTDIIGAFDMAINNVGIRELPKPALYLSNNERLGGASTIIDIKNRTNKSKVIILQPFGRGVTAGTYIDSYGKSLKLEQIAKIVKGIRDKCAVIVMSEFQIDFNGQEGCEDVVQLTGLSLRQWFSLISQCDLFVGCDSVGQHVANTFNKSSVVILGSTFKENVTYPLNTNFEIFDYDANIKSYAPIRLCYDDVTERASERLLTLTDIHISEIIKSIIKKLKAN